MDLADLFKAFSEPIRLRLLHLLSIYGSELCVCDLVTVLDVPQATVSRHLMQLRLQGLVIQRRDGTWMFYKIASTSGKVHSAILRALKTAGADDPALTNDLKRLMAKQKSNSLSSCAALPVSAAKTHTSQAARKLKVTPAGRTSTRRKP